MSDNTAEQLMSDDYVTEIANAICTGFNSAYGSGLREQWMEAARAVVLTRRSSLRKAVREFQLAEAQYIERYASAGIIIAPEIHVEVGLIAAMPYMPNTRADSGEAVAEIRKTNAAVGWHVFNNAAVEKLPVGIYPLFTQPSSTGEVDIDAMCQAFYENKGTMKWDKLLDCWKEQYRSNMRAALSQRVEKGKATEVGL